MAEQLPSGRWRASWRDNSTLVIRIFETEEEARDFEGVPGE